MDFNQLCTKMRNLWKKPKQIDKYVIIIFSYFTGAPGAGGAKSGAGPTIEEVD